MTADEFVARLAAIVPSYAKLEQDGCPPEVISTVRATYLLERCTKAVPFDRDLGEIGSLLRRYDLSNFNFCQVTFLPNTYMDAGAIAFGEEEADPIVMDPATREIRVQQFAKNGFVLARCARDPESFLDALYEVARFMARPRADRERRGECRKAISAAAAAAGGDTYYDFYDMILAGFLDPV